MIMIMIPHFHLVWILRSKSILLPKFVLTFHCLNKLFQWSQSFSRSLEQFFLTVGQNNFGNKIPISISEEESKEEESMSEISTIYPPSSTGSSVLPSISASKITSELSHNNRERFFWIHQSLASFAMINRQISKCSFLAARWNLW